MKYRVITTINQYHLKLHLISDSILNMLEKSYFSKLKKEYIDWLKNKGQINRSSSEILRNSKRVIFAIHRNDMKEASGLLIVIKSDLKTLNKKLNYAFDIFICFLCITIGA